MHRLLPSFTVLVSRFARSPPLSVARVACFREGLGHSLGYSPTWRAFQCPRIKQLCMAGISEASPAEERRQRIRAAAQLWQGADSERQAASEMEIKCLKMRVTSCLFYALFRKGERDLGSASAHRASGPAAWEIQLSSRLFSLFASHPPCL